MRNALVIAFSACFAAASLHAATALPDTKDPLYQA